MTDYSSNLRFVVDAQRKSMSAHQPNGLLGLAKKVVNLDSVEVDKQISTIIAKFQSMANRLNENEGKTRVDEIEIHIVFDANGRASILSSLEGSGSISGGIRVKLKAEGQ